MHLIRVKTERSTADCTGFPRHLPSCQGVPGSLIYNTGKGVARLSSSQGVHQGDPLGPALFSAAIQPILSKMLLERSDVVIHVLAYLDDIYVVGPANALEQVLCDFKVLLSRISLNESSSSVTGSVSCTVLWGIRPNFLFQFLIMVSLS